MKTLALWIAILMAAPALARTELPEGAIALSTVRWGRIVSVEAGRASTRVELELSVGGCANELGPITHTIKRRGMRTTLAVTAIDIVTRASSLTRCTPSGLLRSTTIETAGRYTLGQLRLELLTDATGP
jgi:hypothetical protein